MPKSFFVRIYIKKGTKCFLKQTSFIKKTTQNFGIRCLKSDFKKTEESLKKK